MKLLRLDEQMCLAVRQTFETDI